MNDRSRFDQIAADYARERAATLAAQERMAAVSATVTSPKGLVSVTVGSQGEVRELRFNSQEYRRMAPAELAAAILDTLNRARDSMLQQLRAELPATSINGVSVQDLLDGTADWSALLPDRLTDGAPDRRHPTQGA